MDSGMWTPECGTQCRKQLRQFKNIKLSIVLMLKTEKISVAEANTECTMAFKECSIFQLAIPVPKYKEKFLLERTKVCQVNRPLPKNENR